MSRIRQSSILIAAAAGILITGGGCTGSATAPEAATVRGGAPSLDRASNPTDADTMSQARKRGGDDEISIQSGYIIGGNR